MSTATRTKKTHSVKPAKTAYELLQRVCRHITEEPRRYEQASFGMRDDIVQRMYALSDIPTCGTVACRAGWIVALHDGQKSFRVAIENSSVDSRANEILGMTFMDTASLFSGHAVPVRRDANVRKGLTPREHARKGVLGLRKFMKSNAKHLKARLLKGV